MTVEIGEIFKYPQIILSLISVSCATFAVLGQIPLYQPINLDSPQRIFMGFLAVTFFIMLIFSIRKQPKQETIKPVPEKPVTDENYDQALKNANREIERIIIPESKILARWKIQGKELTVINGNILDATEMDILVSSDDNYLQAKGGVAKFILKAAGLEVEKELEYHRNYRRRLRHGDIAITTGGKTKTRAIFHPAVIDIDRNRYPDKELIRQVVKRIFECANALGAESIALPVLGGGTGSEGSASFSPWDSIEIIISEAIGYFSNKNLGSDIKLNYIALYVYNKDDIKGELGSLFRS